MAHSKKGSKFNRSPKRLKKNAHNTVAYYDATGMVKPDKRQNRLIDGIVALINALALATVADAVADSWDLAVL